PTHEVPRAARRHPARAGPHRATGAPSPRSGHHQHGHALGHRRRARAGARERRADTTALMAETVQETVEAVEGASPSRLCLCEQYVRVTERAALTAARWLGRADQEGAERDAAAAMRRVLDDFPIDGRVIIGSSDEDSPLVVGKTIGAGG